MTAVLDKELRLFFEADIFGDDEEVDDFLSQYSYESVVQCLLEKLKIIAASEDDIDPAWRLGGMFGYINQKYSVDSYAFNWLNILSKDTLLNFISGYWNNAKPDSNILLELSTLVCKAISHEIEWTQESIFSGIQAVSTGYSSLQDRATVIDMSLDNEIQEKLKYFERYLYNFVSDSIDTTQSLQFIQSLLT